MLVMQVPDDEPDDEERHIDNSVVHNFVEELKSEPTQVINSMSNNSSTITATLEISALDLLRINGDFTYSTRPDNFSRVTPL